MVRRLTHLRLFTIAALAGASAISCRTADPPTAPMIAPPSADSRPKVWTGEDQAIKPLPPTATPEPARVSVLPNTRENDTNYAIVTTRPAPVEQPFVRRAFSTTDPSFEGSVSAPASHAHAAGTIGEQHDRPGPDNTGVADQKSLKPSPKIVATDGQVIENLFITGGIVANKTKNVVIRNCLIDAAGARYSVSAVDAENLTIEHCEMYGASSAGMYGSGYTARYNQIYQSAGDGFKPETDCVIEFNWVYNLGWNAPTAHADGVQIRGGSDDRIAWNFFDMPTNLPNTKSNSSIFIQGIKGKRPAGNIVFENNWCNGGNFTVHAYTDGGDPTTLRIANNRFIRGSSRYGTGRIEPGVIWKNNVFDETSTTCQPGDK